MTVPLQADISWLEHHGVKGQKWGVRRKTGGKGRSKAGSKPNSKPPKRKLSKGDKTVIAFNLAGLTLLGAQVALGIHQNRSAKSIKSLPSTSRGNDWIKTFSATPAAMRPFVVNSAGIVSR